MAEDTGKRVSKEVQKVKEVLTKEIKNLLIDKEKTYAVFLKHSHGVYRDEVEQMKAEIEMNQLDKFINVLYKIKDSIDELFTV